MEVVLTFIIIVLVGVWAVWVIKGNQQRPKNNERFIDYIDKYDSDGEPYQAEIWEVSEDEEQTYGITRFYRKRTRND